MTEFSPGYNRKITPEIHGESECWGRTTKKTKRKSVRHGKIFPSRVIGSKRINGPSFDQDTADLVLQKFIDSRNVGVEPWSPKNIKVQCNPFEMEAYSSLFYTFYRKDAACAPRYCAFARVSPERRLFFSSPLEPE